MSTFFRSDALKKLQSPEQLENAFRLTTPVGWLSLVIVGVVLVAVVAWGFLGRLPSQVHGMGVVLKQDSSVYSIVAPAVGRVSKILVSVGQVVHPGDPVAELYLPDQETQREGAQRLLDEMQRQYAHMADFAKTDTARRRANLADAVKALDFKIGTNKQQLAYLQQLYDTERDELAKGYITRQELESTRSKIHAAQQAIQDAQNAIAKARTDQIDFENQQARLLAQQQQQIIAQEGKLASLQISVDTLKVIHSPTEGTVTEVSTKLGSLVAMNDQIAVVEKSGEALRLLAYVPVEKGKSVEPGMPVAVSPTSVESNVYGAIRGKVVSVSSLPATKAGLTALLGESSLVSQMMQPGPVIQVAVELQKDPRTKSGLAWTSSQGPPTVITPGTTATVSVTTDEDRPIDLVVPIYETWVRGS